MPSTNDALTNAFQFLVLTVRDFYVKGRPCLGATLKPALVGPGTFNEQLLGFRKFGDFLRAAAAAGHVQISSTPGGDIRVSLAGARVPDGSPSLPSGLVPPLVPPGSEQLELPFTAAVRIRQDLWNAFNSVSANWIYDRATDVAYKESGTGTWGEQPATFGANIVKIPAGGNRVLEWMRSFANMQDPETKALLATAFEGDGAPYRFGNLVRSKGLHRLWGRFHVQRVLAAIKDWAAANGVYPKNVAEPLYRPAHLAEPQFETATLPIAPRPPVTQTSPRPASAALTGRLESLIDDVIDELIKLRGYLQVVGPKQS